MLHENDSKRKMAHVGTDFPEDELWEMFHSLHNEVLRKVYASDNADLERDFCRATEHYKDPVAFQFNALYLFAESHGLLRKIDTDGLQ